MQTDRNSDSWRLEGSQPSPGLAAGALRVQADPHGREDRSGRSERVLTTLTLQCQGDSQVLTSRSSWEGRREGRDQRETAR